MCPFFSFSLLHPHPLAQQAAAAHPLLVPSAGHPVEGLEALLGQWAPLSQKRGLRALLGHWPPLSQKRGLRALLGQWAPLS